VFERDELYIGGQWVAPSDSEKITVLNSATEEVIGSVPAPTTDDVDRAVAAARKAFDEGPWPQLTVQERAAYLVKIGEALTARNAELADVITQQVGSPKMFSLMGQAPGGAAWFYYYAAIADSVPWTETREGFGGPPHATLVREPMGVVAAIAPWNGPLYLCCSKLAPALLAGCTVVLKPAPETPLDAYLLADAVHEAGLPEGVVSILPAGREIGEHLIRSEGIDKISFTGSTAVGRHIATVAGERLIPYALELGGKSAAIITEDAEPEQTLPALVPGAIMNNGQACAALTRILVPRSREEEWVGALAAAFSSMKVGDPRDESVAVGPLVAERQRDRVEGYLKLAQEEGGTFATGGGRPAGLDRGWFIEPTIITGLTNESRVAREEIFGPVVTVIPYDTEEDAIRIANDSEYGLACGVFTADPERGRRIASKVRAGTCSVNGFFLDLAKPFGGFKASGIGKEGGPEGLFEYTELKSLTVAQPPEIPVAAPR
jgi:aldehyde dehydrogenase (NAD+)